MSGSNEGSARRHPRFQVDVQAAVHTSDGRRLLARTRDLSRSGICLITSQALPSGERLTVELVLLIGSNSESEPLPLRARVVWCTAIARSFQIGAMFDSLSPKESGFLDMFLRYLDGTLLPAGAEMESMEGTAVCDESETESPSTSPDDKDDPFRR
jgi:hypothetical protein